MSNSTNSTIAPPPPSSNTTSNVSSSTSSSSSGAAITAGTIVPVVIVIAIVVFFSIRRRRRRRRRRDSANNGAGELSLHSQRHPSDARAMLTTTSRSGGLGGSTTDFSDRNSSQFGPRNYRYKDLRLATNNFCQSELLGVGGFGSVYRGTLAEDGGAYVAVKCIAENSTQGAKEYKAEVTIISDLRHRNLVRLRGWCHDQGKFLLVYDYMPNGSLDYLLFDDSQSSKLSWERRFSIASGLGSALQYLHDECDNVIIHRDIKSSNVLLDENFVAKLGDFGLSRQVVQGMTSHTTVIAGTRGYMAPECFFGSGRSTRETDVYAFGAVLLELVCGKHVIDMSLVEQEGMLVDWIWNLHSQGKVMEGVDKRLEGRYEEEEARRVLMVGLSCSNPDPKGRPKMRRALEALMGTVALPWVPSSKPTLLFGPPVPMSISEIMDTSATTTSTTSSSNVNPTPDYST